MSCQCYQIGGPFISEDPDCPAHGIWAQNKQKTIERLGEEALLSEDLDKIKQLINEIISLATEG